MININVSTIIEDLEEVWQSVKSLEEDKRSIDDVLQDVDVFIQKYNELTEEETLKHEQSLP